MDDFLAFDKVDAVAGEGHRVFLIKHAEPRNPATMF